MEELTIGEVARRTGLQTSAIRYYESIGLLPAPRRVNGRRRYDPDIFQRLGLIQLARHADFRIGELQGLFTDAEHWRAAAGHKIAELDALIERAQAIKTWLVAAQARPCSREMDCVQVTFDETGRVLLACKNESPSAPRHSLPGI